MNANFARMTAAAGALAGLGLASAACASPGTAAGSSPPASASTAPSPAPSAVPSAPASPSASAGSSAPAATPVPTPTTVSALPGVVAECDSVPPHGLSERPSEIVLACADAGEGVERMAWSGWSASGASGAGSLWLKLCKPNCASGSTGHYPVSVTLSNVKTSSRERYFGTLTIAFTGTRPPATLPASYGLMPPQS